MNIILEQLGKSTLFMLGAKDFVADKNSIQFKIRGSTTFTHIKITLLPEDLYDVKFYKIRSLKVIKEEVIEGAFADMLHDVIRVKTGLETIMPTIINATTGEIIIQ